MEAVPANDLESLLSETAWVSRLAQSLVGDPHAAEDLAQETWLAALRRPPAHSAPLRPWFATVARNAARLERRGTGARRARERDLASERARGGADEAAPPEQLLERAETQELLSRLVRELPPELSEVLLLTFYEGRSSAWIARQRGIPAATVRARKQRALELLRERLDARHDGDRQVWLSALAPLALSATRRGAAGVGVGGFLAGLLAPWFAMSLTAKLVSLLAVALVASLPFLDRGGVERAPRDTAPEPAAVEVAIAPAPALEPAPERAALEAGARAPAPAPVVAAADPEAPPITRVRLAVVDELGRPVSGATVKPSLSLALQNSHAFLEEELGALRMLTIAAEFVRRTSPDGLASWETDLLRFAGVVDFEVEGPHFETGTLRVQLEPGMDEDLGEVVLAPGGAVRGRLRTASGEKPGRMVVELGPVELPADERALERLRRSGPDDPVVEAFTEESGRFRLRGVPAGEYRLYARRMGIDLGRGAWSEPFAVTAGLETAGLEIEVEPLVKVEASLLVLGADGEPLSTARVRIEGSQMTYSGNVDDDGRYSIGQSFDYFAGGRATITDDSLEHRTTVVDPLPLEPEEVVVRMDAAATERRTLQLVGADGTPVATADVGVTGPSGARWWSEVEGAVELVVPADVEGSFQLGVRARGFAPLELPGLTASALPGDWTVELTPQRGIAGVVLSGGEPLERARIELRWQVDEGQVMLSGTEVTCIQGYAVDEARTDADGRFRLHGDVDGDLALVVERSGHADAVLLLDGYVAADGWPDLAIELDVGGTVRGTVVDHTGAPVQGANVVLDHPHHPLKSARTKRDGSFRFRRVASGDWYLRVVDEVEDGFFSWRADVGEDWQFPANCTVAVGSEVTQQLVLPDPEATSIAGRLTIRGADSAQLGKLDVIVNAADADGFRGDPFGEAWESAAELDRESEFEIRLREGRPYLVRLAAPGLGADLRREVAADALPYWLEQELELARVSFARTGAPPAAETDGKVLVSWRGQGWTFDAWLASGEDGAPLPTLVPAGELELAWTDAAGEKRTRAVRVEPGEERELVLD